MIYKKADLHTHTTASDGVLSPEELVEEARKAGLSAIAITDHGTQIGALKAQEYARDKGYEIEVIVGEEPYTERQRHLVGVYLTGPLPSGKSIEETVEAIHSQGGIAFLPHPFAPGVSYRGQEGLVLKLAKIIDGFERHNGGLETLNPLTGKILRRKLKEANRKADRFYRKYKTELPAGIAASDAHFHGEVGTSGIYYQNSIRQDILDKNVRIYSCPEANKPVIPLNDAILQIERSLLLHPVQRTFRFMVGTLSTLLFS